MWRASAPRSTFTSPRAVRRVLALAVTAVLAVSMARAQSDDDALRARVQKLAQEVDLIEKRAELANGEAFYILVDPAQAKLRLMLKAAELREYDIQALEVGTPRVAFRTRNVGGGWSGRIWSQGALVPPRPDDREHIIPPDSTALADSTPAPVRIPLTPEEKYPVPHRYHVRYAGGLSLEVRPQQLDSTLTTWKRVATGLRVWTRDLPATLSREPEDTVRLRLVLEPEDAASLYRALPPDTRLLVLPTL